MLLKILITFVLLSQLGEGVVKFGLKRHESEEYKLLKAGQVPKNRGGHFSTGKSGLTGSKDIIYTTKVSFGNPPQVFRLFPDTGSVLTYIPDSSITTEQGIDFCGQKPCFNSNASSTYIKDGRIFDIYGNLSVGILGIDTVQIGDSPTQLFITNVTFGQLQTLPYWPVNEPLDGVLGLAFQSAAEDNVETVFATAVREKLVDAPIFTIWLKNSNSKDEGNHGQITWGGFDSEHCSSDIIYIPLIEKTYFEFQLNGYSVNDGEKVATNWTVVSATSVPLIYIPLQALRDITEIVNATYDFNYGIYTVDCDAKFNWTVYSGDKALTIDEKVAVIPFDFGDDSKKCILGIDGRDNGEPDVILGDPFFREWCTVHDISVGKIGYARSIVN